MSTYASRYAEAVINASSSTLLRSTALTIMQTGTGAPGTDTYVTTYTDRTKGTVASSVGAVSTDGNGNLLFYADPPTSGGVDIYQGGVLLMGDVRPVPDYGNLGGGGGSGIPQTGGLAESITAATAASGTGPTITTTGTDAQIPLLLSPKGSLVAPKSTTLGASGGYVIVGGTPNGSGGLVVNDVTHNAGGIDYGAFVGNGCVQIFRPSSAPQVGMPWLLFGDTAGNEVFTLSYATTPGADYFGNSLAGDGVVRAFSLTSRVLIGPASTTDTQFASLVVAGVGTHGNLQNAGVKIVGGGTTSPSGVEPTISAYGSCTNLRLQGGSTSGGVIVQTGNGATGIAAVIGSATANNTVNWPAMDGAVTGTGPTIGVSSFSTDTNVDLLLAAKGTGVIDVRYATVALGGGAAPTLGTIGGSGPATAAQNSWLKVKVNGTASYIPIWR